MTISLDEINRITLRIVFLPWFRQAMADLGIRLPEDWNPSDDELEQLATKVAKAFREEEDP